MTDGKGQDCKKTYHYLIYITSELNYICDQ